MNTAITLPPIEQINYEALFTNWQKEDDLLYLPPDPDADPMELDTGGSSRSKKKRQRNKIVSDFIYHHVLLDGKHYHIAHYLDGSWDNKIHALHGAMPIERPAGMIIEPHVWQLQGAGMMDMLRKSPFKGGICADTMGLGKSLTALMLICKVRDEGGKSLIICPTSCVADWQKENAKAFAEGQGLKMLFLSTANTSMFDLQAEEWDVIITTYGTVRASHQAMDTYRSAMRAYKAGKLDKRPVRPYSPLHTQANGGPVFDVVIVDECHEIKTMDGDTNLAVAALNAKAYVLLSGTPIKNNWQDLAGYLTLLKGHPFPHYDDYIATFINQNPPHMPGEKKPKVDWHLSPTSLAYIKKFLMAFTFGRPREVLMPRLRACIFLDHTFVLEQEVQRKVSEQAVKFAKACNSENNNDAGDAPTGQALGAATKALEWALHPQLALSKVDDETGYTTSRPPGKTWQELIRKPDFPLESSRVREVVNAYGIMRRQFPDEKMLIFSSQLRFLDLVQVLLEKRFDNVKCLRYDGSSVRAKRSAVRLEFEEGPPQNPLLISCGAGGVGLNITAASIVIQTEPWWSNSEERQAWARCYRQGQTRDVKIIRLVASNSEIEKAIIQCRDGKMNENEELSTGLWVPQGEGMYPLIPAIVPPPMQYLRQHGGF